MLGKVNLRTKILMSDQYDKCKNYSKPLVVSFESNRTTQYAKCCKCEDEWEPSPTEPISYCDCEKKEEDEENYEICNKCLLQGELK